MAAHSILFSLSRVARHSVVGLIALAALTLAGPSRADEAPTKLIEGFYQTLLEVMREGPKLGFTGRADKIRPAFEKVFNPALMIRVVVGPAWNTTPADVQVRLVESFTRYSVANYAANFKAFDGEKLEVLGAKTTPNGTFVETRIIPNGDAPVPINYLFRPAEGGSLRVADVYLNGTISELATRRSDFARTVQAEGGAGLLQRLDAKTAEMAAGK